MNDQRLAVLSQIRGGLQCVGKTNASQKFSADSVADTVNNLRAVLRGVDVLAIGPFAKRCIHDLDHRLRDGRRVGIAWLQCGEPLERNGGQIRGRALRVLTRSGLIGRLSGVEKVICALSECARHDDGSLNVPACQPLSGGRQSTVTRARSWPMPVGVSASGPPDTSSCSANYFHPLNPLATR